jgi:hypothetical protein
MRARREYIDAPAIVAEVGDVVTNISGANHNGFIADPLRVVLANILHVIPSWCYDCNAGIDCILCNICKRGMTS